MRCDDTLNLQENEHKMEKMMGQNETKCFKIITRFPPENPLRPNQRA